MRVIVFLLSSLAALALSAREEVTVVLLRTFAVSSSELSPSQVSESTVTVRSSKPILDVSKRNPVGDDDDLTEGQISGGSSSGEGRSVLFVGFDKDAGRKVLEEKSALTEDATKDLVREKICLGRPCTVHVKVAENLKEAQSLVDSLRPPGTVRKESDRTGKQLGEREYPADAVEYTLDPFGWVSEYKKTHFGPVHDFPSYNGTNGDYGVYDMGDFENLTIVLGSDFGSGTEETDAVSGFIASEKPHYTIHMGDVYYVGSVEEIDANMMGKPPKGVKKGITWPKGSLGAFAGEGNHEMLSRGFGYFDHFLPQLGFNVAGKFNGQNCSYLALVNKYWRIVILDTGYNSFVPNGIDKNDTPQMPQVVEWMQSILQLGNSSDTRGLMILTHHQYYSAFQNEIVSTAAQLEKILPPGLIPIWLWGHEHRLSFYDPHPINGSSLAAYGRCVGNSGYPVNVQHLPIKAQATYLKAYDNRLYWDELYVADKVGYNGWVTMIFNGPTLRLVYKTIDRKNPRHEFPPKPSFTTYSVMADETFSLSPTGSVLLVKQWFNETMTTVIN